MAVDHRRLTPIEQAVLDRLLGALIEGAERLRAQADDLRVVGGCGCGCPSINFQSDLPGGIGIVAEGLVPDRDRSVLLFVDGADRLYSLELMWMTDAPPTDWPDPASLEVSAP
jgi:hypothetical protein